MSHDKHGGKVKPGSCDPVYGAPPPTEIVCIQVDKVYQECKKVLVNEDEIEHYAPLAVTDVTCLDVKLISQDCTVVAPGRIRVQFRYKIRARVTYDDQSTNEISHVVEQDKTVFLARADEEGLEVKCDIFLECLECFVEEVMDPNTAKVRSTIICCIGKMILVKLFAHVQLLIPAYGFCPEPPECDEVLAICPDFDPEWPPYPPQED